MSRVKNWWPVYSIVIQRYLCVSIIREEKVKTNSEFFDEKKSQNQNTYAVSTAAQMRYFVFVLKQTAPALFEVCFIMWPALGLCCYTFKQGLLKCWE